MRPCCTAAKIQDDIEALISERELFTALDTIKRGERLSTSMSIALHGKAAVQAAAAAAKASASAGMGGGGGSGGALGQESSVEALVGQRRLTQGFRS